MRLIGAIASVMATESGRTGLSRLTTIPPLPGAPPTRRRTVQNRIGSVGRLGAAALTALLAAALGGTSARADPIGVYAFHGAYPMAQSELDNLRGGFVLPDTLLYFTISTQAQIVDNVTGATLPGGYDLSFSLGDAVDLPDNVVVDANGVVTALTAGTGNSAADIASLAEVAGLLNVIQNTQDNITIQQLTELTVGLDVQALAADTTGMVALARQMQDIALIQGQ